ncbi:hypothetical protein [Bosea sp. AAP35]|uniref:hypothetical protein n=1 Tax=Bosea sp. AAP35 TaxID=1523417 RepID=UPI0012E2DA0E|nr:hypothetical protein [Bosea sp. AAP35]
MTGAPHGSGPFVEGGGCLVFQPVEGPRQEYVIRRAMPVRRRPRRPILELAATAHKLLIFADPGFLQP